MLESLLLELSGGIKLRRCFMHFLPLHVLVPEAVIHHNNKNAILKSPFLSRFLIFRRQIIDLKKQGLKTEPAFAKLLALTGDPYVELLSFEL